MVAGTIPFNESLKVAAGDFITHLDDDDEHMPDRIGKLIEYVKNKKLDFAWHPFWFQMPSFEWKLNPAHEMRKGSVTTSSSFYHRWFSQIPWDINAHRYNEPGDWNRFRKIKYLGAKLAGSQNLCCGITKNEIKALKTMRDDEKTITSRRSHYFRCCTGIRVPPSRGQTEHRKPSSADAAFERYSGCRVAHQLRPLGQAI